MCVWLVLRWNSTKNTNERKRLALDGKKIVRAKRKQWFDALTARNFVTWEVAPVVCSKVVKRMKSVRKASALQRGVACSMTVNRPSVQHPPNSAAAGRDVVVFCNGNGNGNGNKFISCELPFLALLVCIVFGFGGVPAMGALAQPLPSSQSLTPTSSGASEKVEPFTIGTSVTSFRPGHNLTFLAVAQQTNWEVGQAGEVRNIKYSTWNAGLTVRYSYHLNLVSKFGMVFGTGIGGAFERERHEGFAAGSVLMFPSLLVGFVQNVENDLRFMALAEYSAFWLPWMKSAGAPEGNGKEGFRSTRIALSPILDGCNFFVQADKFISKQNAVSLNVGWGAIDTNLFGPPAKNTLPAGIRLRKFGPFTSLGMTTTLGE